MSKQKATKRNIVYCEIFYNRIGRIFGSPKWLIKKDTSFFFFFFG